MLWIYLIILQILFFLGLLYFLRFVLTRNISKATGHLQEMSKEYLSKEEEAGRLLQQAQKEAKGILAKETQAAEQAKEKLVQEAQGLREEILAEAHQRSREISEKAQRNAEFMRNELEQKINERAKEKVGILMQECVPREFLKEVHELWVRDMEKEDFNFRHLKLAEKINEASVVAAFALSVKQQQDLKKKLKEKTSAEISVKFDVDAGLLAGFVITLGSVVVEASLRHKIQKAMQGHT